MTEDSPGILSKPVSIKVRVDGSVVAIVKTFEHWLTTRRWKKPG